MGKGDKKTKRGKIILGSYGVRRPRKKTGLAAIEPSNKNIKVVPRKAVKEKAPVKEPKPAKEKVTEKATEKVTEKAEKAVKAPKESKAKKEKKAE